MQVKGDGHYRQCVFSLMDNINDPDITFDKDGISNYYYRYKEIEKKLLYKSESGAKHLEFIVNQIIDKGKQKKYNCILGVSGGVDSSYLALFAKKLGLNPLLVHFDNGWNSSTAVMNINKLVTALGFDLYTYVVDWQEFRDLQLSYLNASVVDIEALTDHAISAVILKIAKKYKINYILNGANIQTETTMPRSWNFSKIDHLNIRSIHKEFGKKKIDTYPIITPRERSLLNFFYNIEQLDLLNYVDYNQNTIVADLKTILGWEEYGDKHFENIWTRFYQGYILPTKFNIDKRKPHYSDLIFSGKIKKNEALVLMQNSNYINGLANNDYDYVLKKLELKQVQFESIMRLPVRSHFEFDYLMPIDIKFPLLRPVKKIYKSLLNRIKS